MCVCVCFIRVCVYSYVCILVYMYVYVYTCMRCVCMGVYTCIYVFVVRYSNADLIAGSEPVIKDPDLLYVRRVPIHQAIRRLTHEMI